jgi:endoglucanase
VSRLNREGIQHPNTVVGVATTQEETGQRGARTVAHEVNPDVCFVVEVDISGDVPGVADKVAPAKMGKGASILAYDSSMIPNQPLKEFVIEVAEKADIPHQLSVLTGGRTDAGVIHMSGAGCPSIVVGVPTRHIHSHVAMLTLSDVDAVTNLLVECVKRLDGPTVSSFTEP